MRLLVPFTVSLKIHEWNPIITGAHIILDGVEELVTTFVPRSHLWNHSLLPETRNFPA